MQSAQIIGRAQTRMSLLSVIIFLHGLGDTPAGWQDAMNWVCTHVDGQCRAICPAAPVRAITRMNGEKTFAWCDSFGPMPRMPSAPEDSVGLRASAASIHQQLDRLIAAGVPAERIIVGGFSQGAAVATLAAYTYSRKLGGCINLSGWLPQLQVNAISKETPLFWGHGLQDQVLSPECQSAGTSLLSQSGVEVTSKTYATLAHSSDEEEMSDVVQFVKRNLSVKHSEL
jgi:predicted esterase